MINLLTAYGFKYLGTCNCSGTRNDKYFNGPYVVYLMVKRYQFKIKKDSNTIVPPTPYAQLETTLKKYALTKIVVGNVPTQTEAVPGR